MKLISILTVLVVVFTVTETAPGFRRKGSPNKYDVKYGYIPPKKFRLPTPNLKGKGPKGIVGGLLVGGNTATIVALGVELLKEKVKNLPSSMKGVQPVVDGVIKVLTDIGEKVDQVDTENDKNLGNSNLLWTIVTLANFLITIGPKIFQFFSKGKPTAKLEQQNSEKV